MFHTLYLGVLLCVAGSQALYDSSSDVVELTPSNFDRLVTNSEEVWIVEFYAPWCGHCKNLVPEYKKAAKALKGIIKVGAVDADQHKSLSSKYGVTGFPTIKIFTGSKHTPYQGQRTADAFVDAGIKAAKERAYDNLGKKSGGSGDKRQLYGHNIPWKKIQRTIEKLKEQNVTQPKKHKPQVPKPLLPFRKPEVPKPLLSFREPSVRKSQNKSFKQQANDKLKPRLQKPLLSFHSSPVKELLSQTSTQQAVIHNKLNRDKLHEQLFRANDRIQNVTQKLQRLSHKNIVHKSKYRVPGPVKKLKLDNLRLFTNNFDSANEWSPKHILRNSNKQLKNALKHMKTGGLQKKVGNRKLAKQTNKTISKKKILHKQKIIWVN